MESVRNCLLDMAGKDFVPKNILVTGGCGFIGSNFINNFGTKHTDIKIINIDRLDYCSRKKNVIISENYTLVEGDIKDFELLKNTLEDYNIDTVIHFAAQTHVDNSFENSIKFTEDNVLGTHVLLEACHNYGKIKRFVHMSTDEVYGEVGDDHSGCTEISLLNPTNPYSATKAGAEFLVRSYSYSFNLPIIIVRGNNVYGPRQYPEKLIPKFVLKLNRGEKCTVHGQGKTRRNFIHVDDVANALEQVLYKGELKEIYNIGTRNEYSVMEITKLLVNYIYPEDDLNKWIEYVEDRKWNDYRYHISNSKLCNIGWSEKIQFSEGLDRTIEWYLENAKYFD